MDMVETIKVTKTHVTMKLERETARRLMYWVEALHRSELKDIDEAAKELTKLLASPDPWDEKSSEPFAVTMSDEVSDKDKRAQERFGQIRSKRTSIIWASVRADAMSDFMTEVFDFWHWDAD